MQVTELLRASTGYRWEISVKKSGKSENGYTGLRADGLLQRIFSGHMSDLAHRPIASLPKSRISETPMGRRSVVVAGTGAPTVVFEAGLGKGKEDWKDVFDSVAGQTRAIAYDRAGYGGSEP